VYRVSVEGTQDLGSGNITFYVGDFAIYNGSIWERSPGTDITGKMDLVATPTNGDVLTTDASGQAIDSGILASDLVVTSDLDSYMLLTVTPTDDNILTTDTNGQATDSGVAIADVMLLATTPTDGNILTTDTNGQATDSGVAVADVMLLIDTPTDGNIVTTDTNGQTTDSGKTFTTDVDSGSTDNEIPTALAVYTAITDAVAPGTVQKIKISATTTTATSTYSIPDGAMVESVSVRVGTQYSAGGTIAISCGAVSLLATDVIDAQTVAVYSVIEPVDIATGAVISVTIAGAPAAGACDVFVNFVASPIA